MARAWGSGDGIEVWASRLTPEAFAVATSAFVVAPELDGLADEVIEQDAAARFGAWVDQRLDEAVVAQGWSGPPAWLVFAGDGNVLRRYDDCGCGRIECVLEVADELRGLTTPWLLAADLSRRPSEISPLARSRLPRRWYLDWYAEARGRGVAARLAGFLQMRGEHVMQSSTFTPEQLGVAGRFADLLRGHPARRRHPIRST
ncbi:MAG TPA: hypothetical protein VK906_11445 [Egicoccus sp.]|nr:hypothetical protein [Egicoccus sp.]HSK23786.1 hypothetical protein [Egicoccus sp.]